MNSKDFQALYGLHIAGIISEKRWSRSTNLQCHHYGMDFDWFDPQDGRVKKYFKDSCCLQI